jgi:hypothetical protein
MEEEIQTIQPVAEPIEVQNPKPILKYVLFGVLGILGILGILYAGIAIGKKQASPNTQLTTAPTVTPEVSPTPDPTVNWKTYTSSKYLIEFKYPGEWVIKELNDRIEICISQSLCFNLVAEKRDFDTFLKNQEKIIGCPFVPNEIYVGEENLRGQNLYSECNNKVNGFLFIPHSPQNLVIDYNSNDFYSMESGGAILSTFKFLD